VFLRRSSQHTFTPHMQLHLHHLLTTFTSCRTHLQTDLRASKEKTFRTSSLTIEHTHSDETKVHKMPS
jgi:hypothetical protein